MDLPTCLPGQHAALLLQGLQVEFQELFGLPSLLALVQRLLQCLLEAPGSSLALAQLLCQLRARDIDEHLRMGRA